MNRRGFECEGQIFVGAKALAQGFRFHVGFFTVKTIFRSTSFIVR
jgi:hypothetical protein